MVQSAPSPQRLRVVVLFMVSAFIGRSFCIGSSSIFPEVGTDHIKERDYHHDSAYVRSEPRELEKQVVKEEQADEESSSADTDAGDTDNTVVTETAVDRVHILYGLSGNTTAFTDEFHVSLKSVIMNAPIDMAMSVHLLADGPAYKAISEMTEEEIKLSTLVARQPISIDLYNMESKGKEWRQHIIACTGHWLSSKHTMGTFFRLFAYDVLPVEAEHVVYIDTDAVVISNLQELWKHRNSSAMFQWGNETHCAGFMILNLKQMRERFWNMVNSTYEKDFKRHVNDQEILKNLIKYYPDVAGEIPPEWDNHRADNMHFFNGDALLKLRPDMGMLHFNGGGGRDVNKFEEPKRLEYSVVPYMANHPWQWVGFMLRSQIPPGKPGYPVVLTKTVL